MEQKKVCLVTGGSSGIGLETMKALKASGFCVYGTSRRIPPGEVVQLNGFDCLYLDLADADSAKSAIDTVVQRDGRIDLLVNNAGFGVSGAAEDMPFEDAISQMDANFFGALRVMRAALPYMREQGGGRIINIGSLAAEFAVPFQSIYSASKAALRSLTSAMRAECAPFGIELSVVEPGDTKTGFTDSRKKPDVSYSPYAKGFEKGISKMERDERNGAPPKRVADAVVCIALCRKMPPIRTVGLKNKLLCFARRLLPTSLADRIVRQMYS
ncbi:MAG: SDR family oxidoreductase [Clostridia bacterium]|nr:SDR family oxidoreductase [Clostridia bacterium]